MGEAPDIAVLGQRFARVDRRHREDGLSAALFGGITLADGAVEQSNFPTYNVVRLAEAPVMDVHIVASDSPRIGGVGEPGTPPIAPAVANAVFAATGKRLRTLPLSFD